MEIILRTWFQTGLGDFYACLLSTKIAHDKLKSLGYTVIVIITYEHCHYGCDDQTKLINNCFNLSEFDSVQLNGKIPEDFSLYKNIQWAYEIYTKNNTNQDLLNNITLYGYSVENIYRGQPYPDNTHRIKTLFSESFLNELESISKPFENFITIFYRFSDSYEPSIELIGNIKTKILEISNENKNHKIFISCKIPEISQLTIPDVEIVNFEYDVQSNYDRVKRDLLNMSLFMFTDKLYFSISHWSNFLTLSLIHNTSNKNYEEFLIQI